MARKQKRTEDELEDRFAAVFHSFKDLHKVSPNQFLARLARRGVVVMWKSKRRRAKENADG